MVMPDEQPVDPNFDGDIMLCPHCLAENPEDQHFCHQCATPLSSLSVIDPVGSIHAQADTFHKAIFPKSNRAMPPSAWLILGLALIVSVLITLATLWRSIPALKFGWYEVVGLVGCIAAITLAYRLIRNYVPKSPAPQNRAEDKSDPPGTNLHIDGDLQ